MGVTRLLDEVTAAAKRHGWSVVEIRKSNVSNSRYVLVQRGDSRVTIRVSDHPRKRSKRCNYDFLVMSEDDLGDLVNSLWVNGVKTPPRMTRNRRMK